ncbi:unnamed protein product, partial [Cuscuta europaea]
MHGLKKLVVVFYTTRDEILVGLMAFIRISPNLEELVLKVTLFSDLSLGRRRINKGTPFPHQHLKVLKYLGYYGHGSDLELVKSILELDLLHGPPDPAESEYE